MEKNGLFIKVGAGNCIDTLEAIEEQSSEIAGMDEAQVEEIIANLNKRHQALIDALRGIKE